MDVVSLFSGGKDSTYALYLAKKQGNNVRYLISVIPEKPESWMFHFPNAALAAVQAERIDIPLIQLKVKTEKEKELTELKHVIEGLDVEGVVTGAVASEYQKSRIDRMCAELGIRSIAPLWHKEQETMLREEILIGFRPVFTAVAAEGFDESWLGREMDGRAIDDLKALNKKYGVSLVGEGGEFETFVVDCPMFSKPLKIKKSKKHWEKTRGWLEILELE